jgi:hypothetical protein
MTAKENPNSQDQADAVIVEPTTGTPASGFLAATLTPVAVTLPGGFYVNGS